MEEIWKDIENYEGYYQCSNLGRVRSVDRYIKGRYNNMQFKKGQLLKPRLNVNGYLQVSIDKQKHHTQKYIHRLVAETFIDNPNNSETINHKDGNKTNNCVENLEWTSYSENAIHAYHVLHRTICNNNIKPVGVIFEDTYSQEKTYYNSIAETSRSVGLSCTQIRRYIQNKKLWKGRFIFQTDNNKCVEDSKKVS